MIDVKNSKFDHLNLEFESGKVYALIGPSGSGKTTLLNILGHLEKIDDGDILIRTRAFLRSRLNSFSATISDIYFKILVCWDLRQFQITLI